MNHWNLKAGKIEDSQDTLVQDLTLDKNISPIMFLDQVDQECMKGSFEPHSMQSAKVQAVNRKTSQFWDSELEEGSLCPSFCSDNLDSLFKFEISPAGEQMLPLENYLFQEDISNLFV